MKSDESPIKFNVSSLKQINDLLSSTHYPFLGIVTISRTVAGEPSEDYATP